MKYETTITLILNWLRRHYRNIYETVEHQTWVRITLNTIDMSYTADVIIKKNHVDVIVFDRSGTTETPPHKWPITASENRISTSDPQLFNKIRWILGTRFQ